MGETASKVDVSPELWDNIFAPSSCLVLITTVSRDDRVNAAAFGTCTRVCHDPVYIAFTCGTGTASLCRTTRQFGRISATAGSTESPSSPGVDTRPSTTGRRRSVWQQYANGGESPAGLLKSRY